MNHAQRLANLRNADTEYAELIDGRYPRTMREIGGELTSERRGDSAVVWLCFVGVAAFVAERIVAMVFA